MIAADFSIDDAVSLVENDSPNVPLFQSMVSADVESTLTYELFEEILMLLQPDYSTNTRIMDDCGDSEPDQCPPPPPTPTPNPVPPPMPEQPYTAQDSPDSISGDTVVEFSAYILKETVKNAAKSLSPTANSPNSDGSTLAESISPNNYGSQGPSPRQREQQMWSSATPGTQEGPTLATFNPLPSNEPVPVITLAVSSTAALKTFSSTSSATRDDVTSVQGPAAWSNIADYFGDVNTIVDYAHKAGGSFKMPSEMKAIEWSLKIAGKIKSTDQPVPEFAMDATKAIAAGWIAGVAGEAIFSTALAAAGATTAAPLAAGAATVAGAALLGYYGGKVVEKAFEASPQLLHQHVTPIISEAAGSAQDALMEFSVYLDSEIRKLYPTGYP